MYVPRLCFCLYRQLLWADITKFTSKLTGFNWVTICHMWGGGYSIIWDICVHCLKIIKIYMPLIHNPTSLNPGFLPLQPKSRIFNITEYPLSHMVLCFKKDI